MILVCVCLCVYIILHITAQSGPVGVCVCVCIELHMTAQSGLVTPTTLRYSYCWSSQGGISVYVFVGWRGQLSNQEIFCFVVVFVVVTCIYIPVKDETTHNSTKTSQQRIGTSISFESFETIQVFFICTE